MRGPGRLCVCTVPARYDEAVRKRSWTSLLIRAAILAAIMLYLTRSHSSLFRLSKAPPPDSPSGALVTGDAASGERFAWVPEFAGAQKENIKTVRTHQQVSFGYRFPAKQDEAQVLTFYETRLRALGFTVVKKLESGELHAESPDRKRIFDVTLGKIPDGTEVGVAAVER